MRSLRALENDETLLVQSGKPVAVFRTHTARAARAHREQQPRGALGHVGRHFRELERKGLMMYGQMTAGSWIYIGSQGIRAGHLRDVRRGRAPALRRHRSPAASSLTAGLGGMGGAQPLAATMQGAAFLGVEVDESRIDEARRDAATATRSTRSLDEALALDRRGAARRGTALSVGARRQRRRRAARSSCGAA